VGLGMVCSVVVFGGVMIVVIVMLLPLEMKWRVDVLDRREGEGHEGRCEAFPPRQSLPWAHPGLT
jgi:hypothetical protein